MHRAFSQILDDHLARYPLMEPRDCVKLAYQSALGPAHGAPDRRAALRSLLAEWGSIPADCGARPPEDIGNGLCRLYLAGTDDLTLAAPLLADLFCLTARDFRGSEALLAEDLAVLETAGLPGMADYQAVS